jgi:iron-sulfur cluster repair protein YtfE (RIC family)
MAASVSDPLRQFEHSHATLTKLTLEIREMIHAEPRQGRVGVAVRRRLVALLETLRDELLDHFANEEEGLFPFLRANVPAKARAVDKLESAHDTICGSVVRLAHLAAHDDRASRTDGTALRDHYERFEAAYTAHSRDEVALFGELAHSLNQTQRAELADLLRGL